MGRINGKQIPIKTVRYGPTVSTSCCWRVSLVGVVTDRKEGGSPSRISERDGARLGVRRAPCGLSLPGLDELRALGKYKDETFELAKEQHGLIILLNVFSSTNNNVSFQTFDYN